MKYEDLPFVLTYCAAALRKYSEYLKECDSESDVSDLASWYLFIEKYGYDFESMTLKDLEACMHGSYWHLTEFTDLLKEDDDPEWRAYELLCRVLHHFVSGL